MPYPTYLPDPPAGKKWVSIWIGNIQDQAVNITIGTATYSNATISGLVAAYSSIFQFVTNPNGQTDLAFLLDNTTTMIIGSFKEASTTNAYNAQSWDFDYIGGKHKPKPRCPGCP